MRVKLLVCLLILASLFGCTYESKYYLVKAHVKVGGVIIPENHWVENWTSPAFDALGERDEEIKIHGKPDPGNFEAMMRIRK